MLFWRFIAEHNGNSRLGRRVLVLASSLFLVCLLVTGCSPVKRHALVSVFIDGVPAYVSPEERARLREEELAKAGPGQLVSGRSGFAQEPMRFFHGPYASNECSRCHKMDMAPGGARGAKGGRSAGVGWRSSMAGKDILRRPVDELCLPCHDDFSQSSAGNEGLWIHGPVSSGWCVMCHDPHASPYENLLLDGAIANLCAGCHRGEDLLATTREHRNESAPAGDETGELEKVVSLAKDCTFCHDPHRGRDQRLLRVDYGTRAVRPVVQEQAVAMDGL